MKKYAVLREILVIVCCAFTTVLLSFVLLPEILVPILSKEIIIQTFFLCLSAAMIGSLTISFNIANFWLYHGTVLASVFLAVFGVGSFVFRLIPFEIEVYMSVSITVIIIYITCVFLLYKSNKIDANKINRKLNQNLKKEEKS